MPCYKAFMTSKVVAFILGIALGAGVCAMVLSKRTKEQTYQAVQSTEARFSNEISAIEASHASADKRLRQAQEENEALSARVQELLKVADAKSTEKTAAPNAKPKGMAALFGGDGTNEMSQAMSAMMKSAAEQQMEATISGLKSRLNLSPEQEKAIRDIMTKRMGFGTEIAQKMFKGDLTEEELKELSKDQPKQKDQIKAVLTPEQVGS